MAEPRVEILCVGTELLLGDILNGNARWIAEQLAALGLTHYRQTVVGDNKERLSSAALEASSRCDVLITTGGLGPTPDDLTTASLAAAFTTPLEERGELWEEIKAKLGANGRPVAESNRRQAFLPRGAEVLPNPVGSAPGMIWTPRKGFTVLTFPGVPSEMRAMWSETAEPWFRAHKGSSGVLVSRQLRFTGIGESTLAEQVPDLLELENPTVAPYAALGDVRLRLTARGDNQAAASRLLDPVEQELRERFGPCCYGMDTDTLPSVVLLMLREARRPWLLPNRALVVDWAQRFRRSLAVLMSFRAGLSLIATLSSSRCWLCRLMFSPSMERFRSRWCGPWLAESGTGSAQTGVWLSVGSQVPVVVRRPNPWAWCIWP